MDGAGVASPGIGRKVAPGSFALQGGTLLLYLLCKVALTFISQQFIPAKVIMGGN